MVLNLTLTVKQRGSVIRQKCSDAPEWPGSASDFKQSYSFLLLNRISLAGSERLAYKLRLWKQKHSQEHTLRLHGN